MSLAETNNVRPQDHFISPAIVVSDWGTSGGAWNNLAGQTPTFDCYGTATGPGYTCNGATLTGVAGATSSLSPYYPTGFSGTPTQSIIYNGTSEYFSGGNIAQGTTDFTLCISFTTDTIAAGTAHIVGKDGGGGASTALKRAYYIGRNAATVNFVIFQDDTTSSTLAVTTALVAKVKNHLCVSYDYVADGTSVMRANFNGVVPTAITNANGPIQSSDAVFRLGANAADPIAQFFDGDISHVTFYSGWAAGATDLAQMVNYASRTLLIKPVNTSLSIVRNSTEFYCAGGAGDCFFTPANRLAISNKGIGVWNSGGHNILYTRALDNGVWIPESNSASPVAITANQAAGRDGAAAKADLVAIPAVSGANAYNAVCQSFTATAVKWTAAVWLRSTTVVTSTPYLYFYNGSTYYKTQCSVGNSWATDYPCWLTSSSNLTAATWKICLGTDLRDATQSATSAFNVYADFFEGYTDGAYPTYGVNLLPSVEVAGTPVSVPVSDITTPVGTGILKCGGQWCITSAFEISRKWGTNAASASDFPWAIGGGENTANRGLLEILPSRAPRITMRDSDNNACYISTSALSSATPAPPVKITFCFNINAPSVATAGQFMIDGVEYVTGGGGTCDIKKFNTPADFFTLGGRVFDTAKLDGYIKSFKACCGSNPYRCQ